MSSTSNKKSQKRMRGIPVHYDELKKAHNIMLTNSSWEWLRASAKQSGVSVGELIERWVRSQVD
ncbi:MAG: hypothetical protein F6K50_53115 [Moorea sp. SIO3I7]|uniref:hypothetical protein n=1 Tax=Moorena sp. SIO3I6 TaxID=2607831 RepID=UPI0013C71055|nr:hypothetical protein [Moorena sp. SIO3I6]NEO03724.1 hypothetical protein [Moorena sp. SIO3I7]NEO64741.1 hypothetical protein [Moorena sp. SIO4G2]NEP27425.1 hypothetical protein [Moorena sp. SIO3I6]